MEAECAMSSMARVRREVPNNSGQECAGSSATVNCKCMYSYPFCVRLFYYCGMATDTFTLRLDGDLKNRATAVAEYYGLDLPSVTRAFYTQMVREHSIPLNFAASDPFLSQENLEYLTQKNKAFQSGTLPFVEHSLAEAE